MYTLPLFRALFKLFPQIKHWLIMIACIILGRNLLKQEKLINAEKLSSDLTEKELIKQKRLLFWGNLLFWGGILFLMLFSFFEFVL